jgi:hypothetical protein
MSVYKREGSKPHMFYYQYISKRREGARFYYDDRDEVNEEIARIRADEEKRNIKKLVYSEYQHEYYIKIRRERLLESKRNKVYHVNKRGYMIIPRYLKERERKYRQYLEERRLKVERLSQIELTDEDLIIDFTLYT